MRAAAGACFTALLLMSCQSADTNAELGVTSVQFRDVRVPGGLTKQDRDSYSQEAASFRKGHFVYTGQNKVEEASMFVRQQMPQHGWTLTADEAKAEEGVRLRFERGVYSVEYRFTRIDGLTQMVVDYNTDFNRR